MFFRTMICNRIFFKIIICILILIIIGVIYCFQFQWDLACEQIDIGPGCSLERLTTKISSGSTLKVRLIEDKRLNVLYDKCKDFYFNDWVHKYS
jgi:hypothetical protein